MATRSNILAWKIPWTVELGRLQLMGSQRVGHDWATKQNSITCNGASLVAQYKESPAMQKL